MSDNGIREFLKQEFRVSIGTNYLFFNVLNIVVFFLFVILVIWVFDMFNIKIRGQKSEKRQS